jgi:hypothetical protein
VLKENTNIDSNLHIDEAVSGSLHENAYESENRIERNRTRYDAGANRAPHRTLRRRHIHNPPQPSSFQGQSDLLAQATLLGRGVLLRANVLLN